MKKILILLAIVIGLTSCPQGPKEGGSITIIKFTNDDYANYVIGMKSADSVVTDKSYFDTGNQPIRLIRLCDGWWYMNVLNTQSGAMGVLGDMTWEEFNSLLREGKYCATSALKDPHPYADITNIRLSGDIGLVGAYSDVYYQNDSSSIVVRLREIIANGELKKFRNDWITERMGLR
ncbi:MAG: hypothetical protein J6Z12_00805 [Paludibacteraceae bacterium]|nr:hypothetical protein [Paludibacteraceae bacterium]